MLVKDFQAQYEVLIKNYCHIHPSDHILILNEYKMLIKNIFMYTFILYLYSKPFFNMF